MHPQWTVDRSAHAVSDDRGAASRLGVPIEPGHPALEVLDFVGEEDRGVLPAARRPVLNHGDHLVLNDRDALRCEACDELRSEEEARGALAIADDEEGAHEVGIVGAAILGLGRAFGETIAVTMLIGNNVLAIPHGIMRPGSTMPSVIANEFTEANQPFHLDSLFVVAFALLLLSLVVNIIGKRVVGRVSEHIA